MWRSDRGVAAALGLASAAIFLVLTRDHPTVWDYFGRLAVAFWHGEWWLDGAPSHLNELVAGVGGHRYALAPPLPAVLLVPLVPFVATDVAQTALSAVLGGLSASPLFLAQRSLLVPVRLATTTTLLSTFGTTLFVTAIDGRSWYAADAITFFFAALALWSASARGPALLTGIALGAAILTRAPLALAAPALVALQARDLPPRSWVGVAARVLLGAAPFVVAYVVYDLARWGTPLDVGYATFAADDPFYSRGLFSASYLPRHLYAMFLEPPAFVDGQLFFLRPRSGGMSLLVATPALLWFARAVVTARAAPVTVALLLGCLTLLPDVFFGTIGFEQYGYRRSLDAQAFLIPLLAIGGGWAGTWLPSGTPLFRAAVALSIAATLYFFQAIRLYGYA